MGFLYFFAPPRLTRPLTKPAKMPYLYDSLYASPYYTSPYYTPSYYSPSYVASRYYPSAYPYSAGYYPYSSYYSPSVAAAEVHASVARARALDHYYASPARYYY